MSYVYTSTSPVYGNITLTQPNQSAGSYTIGPGIANGTSATDLWSATSWSTAPVTITQKATIDLKGEDADIVINGESLRDSIKEIKEALRIPGKLEKRDPELEKKWEELQEAANHYHKLLEEYKQKQKVWDTLKNQDA